MGPSPARFTRASPDRGEVKGGSLSNRDTNRRCCQLCRSVNAIASREPAVTRTNVLYLVIGALTVAVAVLSYQLYQDPHQPEGVHIELGPGGLSIQGNKSK